MRTNRRGRRRLRATTQMALRAAPTVLVGQVVVATGVGRALMVPRRAKLGRQRLQRRPRTRGAQGRCQRASQRLQPPMSLLARRRVWLHRAGRHPRQLRRRKRQPCLRRRRLPLQRPKQRLRPLRQGRGYLRGLVAQVGQNRPRRPSLVPFNRSESCLSVRPLRRRLAQAVLRRRCWTLSSPSRRTRRELPTRTRTPKRLATLPHPRGGRPRGYGEEPTRLRRPRLVRVRLMALRCRAAARLQARRRRRPAARKPPQQMSRARRMNLRLRHRQRRTPQLPRQLLQPLPTARTRRRRCGEASRRC
mmetsp:Transcript_24578/g.85442  ORF Transcript_24578/g.85442 Transcript_24578/m.85442 type:complete len:304 (+) Transcript_24578:2438-3349(+)